MEGIERIPGQRKPKLSSVSQIRLTITYGFYYIAPFMGNIRVLQTIPCDGPGISEYRFELKRGRGSKNRWEELYIKASPYEVLLALAPCAYSRP